jgi:hypothetical protein
MHQIFVDVHVIPSTICLNLTVPPILHVGPMYGNDHFTLGPLHVYPELSRAMLPFTHRLNASQWSIVLAVYAV